MDYNSKLLLPFYKRHSMKCVIEMSLSGRERSKLITSAIYRQSIKLGTEDAEDTVAQFRNSVITQPCQKSARY